METSIRKATEKDLEAILEIYNHSIIHTTSVYSYKPYSIAMLKKWFDEKAENNYPVFVAETDNKVVGFAVYGSFRNWPAYKYSVEHSVHVHPDYRRRGIAKKLMQEIINFANKNKVHTIIAGIDASNTASIQLHKQLGFEEVAHFKEVGYKFGKWLDLKFFQLILKTSFHPNED
jgi:phosphinothricin acetyltransferase